jgi:NAD(P)-dependent dehydrogenase (short-subunit alcohol dehydrogenase family)
MRELSGRVAVVTGAASGIGRALAERFAVEGMKVVLADSVEAKLRATVDELRARGFAALGVRTDVTDQAAVDDLAQAALDAYGAVHLVCNNAGIAVASTRCWEISLEDWQWVIDVNLLGVLHGVRTFTPILLEQGFGHIVNTASMAGLRPYPGGVSYCVSKAGVVALSEILYHEVRSTGVDVGVSMLCPGATNTEGWRRAHTVGSTMESRQVPGDDPGRAEVDLSGISEIDSPAAVADAVLHAVVEDRFYVFPQPAMKARVRDRMERLLDELPPALPDVKMPSA